MFATIFVMVNLHYQAIHPDMMVGAYRTRELCEAAIKEALEEVPRPEFGSSARSGPLNTQCVAYRLETTKKR